MKDKKSMSNKIGLLIKSDIYSWIWIEKNTLKKKLKYIFELWKMESIESGSDIVVSMVFVVFFLFRFSGDDFDCGIRSGAGSDDGTEQPLLASGEGLRHVPVRSHWRPAARPVAGGRRQAAAALHRRRSGHRCRTPRGRPISSLHNKANLLLFWNLNLPNRTQPTPWVEHVDVFAQVYCLSKVFSKITHWNLCEKVVFWLAELLPEFWSTDHALHWRCLLPRTRHGRQRRA